MFKEEVRVNVTEDGTYVLPRSYALGDPSLGEQPFLGGGWSHVRCGVIYCADAHGNFCCRQSLGAVCCGPGAELRDATETFLRQGPCSQPRCLLFAYPLSLWNNVLVLREYGNELLPASCLFKEFGMTVRDVDPVPYSAVE